MPLAYYMNRKVWATLRLDHRPASMHEPDFTKECAVCMSEYTDTKYPLKPQGCRHVICAECLYSWLCTAVPMMSTQSNTGDNPFRCMYCRERFDSEATDAALKKQLTWFRSSYSFARDAVNVALDFLDLLLGPVGEPHFPVRNYPWNRNTLGKNFIVAILMFIWVWASHWFAMQCVKTILSFFALYFPMTTIEYVFGNTVGTLLANQYLYGGFFMDEDDAWGDRPLERENVNDEDDEGDEDNGGEGGIEDREIHDEDDEVEQRAEI